MKHQKLTINLGQNAQIEIIETPKVCNEIFKKIKNSLKSKKGDKVFVLIDKNKMPHTLFYLPHLRYAKIEDYVYDWRNTK